MKRGRFLVAGLVALVAPAVPSSAAAAPAPARAESDGAIVRYLAAPGQVNRPVVTLRPGRPDINFVTYVVTIDDVVTITPDGDGCTRPGEDATVVECRFMEQQNDPYGMEFHLGDRDDRWTGGGGQVFGGPGNDVLSGAGALFGEAGDDSITGTDGADRLNGGSGNDLVRGGRGNDLIVGGTGNDRLYGNSGNDVIHGNSGNDRISGGPGADRLSGGPGRNTVRQD